MISVLLLAGDILHASDVLDEISEKYNAFVVDKKEKAKSPVQAQVSNSDSLLDFAGANVGKVTPKSEIKKDVMDELGDIFSADTGSSITEPLKPVNLMSCGMLRTKILSSITSNMYY